MKQNKQNQIIFFFPDIQVGGVEKNFFIISKYLTKFFSHTYLITTNKLDKKIDKKIKLIRISKFWFYLSRRFVFLICTLKLLFTSIKYKDAIIFSFQGNFYALLISIILKRKIIVRSNLSPIGWHGSHLKIKVFKFLLSKASVVIVNSSDFQKQMKKIFSIDSTKIFNPVNVNEIKSLSVYKNKTSFFKKNTINLINVGRLVKQKNQIEILLAFIKLKNFIKNYRLLIIGYGPDKLYLENFIKKNKLKKYVKIIFVNNSLKYIRMSDVYISSSKYEGLPNTLLEAAHLNKYIISSNCKTGPSEIIKIYKNGELYKMGNINELYLKIKNLNKKKLLNQKTNFLKNLSVFDHKINLKKYLKTILKIL